MTAEPVIGSPAWLQRRKELWDQQARDLVAALVKYEDEHPAEAICLSHTQRHIFSCRHGFACCHCAELFEPLKPSPTEARRGY